MRPFNFLIGILLCALCSFSAWEGAAQESSAESEIVQVGKRYLELNIHLFPSMNKD